MKINYFVDGSPSLTSCVRAFLRYLLTSGSKARSITLLCSLIMAFTLSAQQYCLTEPFGYGRNATGGTGGTVVTVNSFEALANSLGDYDKTSDGKYRVNGDSEKRIVVITKSITFPYLLNITDCSNKTILALPGVVLSNPTKETQGSGIMYFLGGSNIILRNITFKGPGAEDLNGYDPLCFDGVTNAWVDHCDFSDGIDGNFDNKGDTDNITVSWCRFSYSSASTEHAFTNLVGSSSSDKPSDGRYNITWAYCWWDDGCVERMPRARHSQFHLLNNYWSSKNAKRNLGLGGCDAYVEGGYFESKKAIIYEDKSDDDHASGNNLKFVNCVGASDGLPANEGSVSAPTYAYTALTAAEAKTAVTNASCGAGATLMVTESGVVTSPCASTPCTISFNPNGGAGTMTPQSAYEDITTVLKANTFTRSGYAFQGWATSAGSSTVAYADKASVTPTGNMTLYAVWKVAQTYTLTFNANGGTCGVTSLTYTDGGAPLTMPVPTLDGKVCTGWFTAASGGTKIASAGATYTPTATQTLYAQWTDAPPCFVPGTATLGSGTTATLADGTKVTMTNCTINEENIVASESGANILFEFPNTISAFSFTATCGSDGKNNYYSLNGNDEVALAASTKAAQTYEIPISGDVTSVKIRKSGTGLTMTEICYSLNGSSSSYTVTYETNGGNSIAQVTGVTKLPNPLPTPTKSGATFDGWYTNAGLTIEAVAGSTINENTTLYAKWTPVATGDVTYTADNSIFPNPERGFYEHIEQRVKESGNESNLSDSYFTNGKAAGRSLILRLYYLDNFRDKELTSDVMNLINTDMQKLRDKGFKCILRFAYTNTASDNPSENKDANPAIWQAHLAQLKSTLAANADVIYVVQAGFLGAWGEWYYSSQGKGESIPMATKTNLINQLLDAVPASRVVQLRTPKYKTDYLGSTTALTASEAYKSTEKARLGHHNDAFLNGDENQGTYENVTADKAYIAQECLYVPVGGETNHDDDASTINTHATGDKAVAEMAYLHYSYLNQGYSHAVTDLWRSTGHFDIMSRNLGYRFQLQAGTFSDEAVAGGTMAVNITLKNVGYAPLYYERPAYIVLKNATNTYSLKLSSDPRSWQPNGATTTINENLTIPASVAPGTYNLYLHLPDASASLAAKPAFAVRFANTDIWESATGYNKLNAQIVVTGTGLPTYEVTFDANGHGTAPTAQTIVENATATEPAALTATGYTFGGWYKEAACNNKFDFSTPITASITLYAKWTAIPTYTVTLNGMTNGTVSASKTTGINEGETITLTVTPASGYQLGTISVKDAADNNITLTDNKFTMPASNVTISATFTEISSGGGGEQCFTVSATSGSVEIFVDGTELHGIDSDGRIGNTKFASKDIIVDGAKVKGPSLSDQRMVAKFPCEVSKIVIYGYNSSSGRTLKSVSTSTTAEKSSYVPNTTALITSEVQTPNYSYIFTVDCSSNPIPANTYVWFAFSNSVNVYSICYTSVASCTTPTISWTTAPADGEVGEADITLGVDKGLSTGAVTYTSSNPAVATVVDGKLHYVSSGSTTITATVAADGTHCEATLTETIDVTCAAPANPLSITATPTVITMGETANIAVTGGNGGEVNYSVAPATASVSGGVFNASAAGTYVITATQAEYNGQCAGTATATIQVNEVVLPTYTLSYNLNGHGTAISDATVSALPNPLPTPSELGWTFGGWFTDNTLTTPATPGSLINANTTLYAKWTEVVAGGCAETYVYAYNDVTRYDGANYKNPEGNEASSGDNVALTTPWTLHSGVGIASIVLNGGQYDGKGNHMNAYIKMNASASLVITLANDAVGTLTIKAGGYNDARTLTLSADGQTAQSKTTTGVATTENDFGELTFTLYPGVNTIKVNKNTYISHISVSTECLTLYNITTDPAIVNGTVSVVDEAVAGTTVTLTATPSTGYVLDSWTVKDAADNAITVTDNKFTMPASDVTVTATFRPIRTYTVKFDGNGATGGAMTDQTGIQEGVATPLTANAFTFGTKIFNGWNTMSDGSGTAYADGASVTLTDVNTTLTLYAQWKDPATYTVAFSLNGKTGTAPTEVMVTEGEKITKPTPDPEVTGYTFGGWYKEPACTNAWNFDTDIVINTTTLYAKWTKELVPCQRYLLNIANVTLNGDYFYEEAGKGAIMKNKTGSSNVSFSDGDCDINGATLTKYYGTSSSLVVFKTYNKISGFTIYGKGTGSNRTLSKVEVGTTTANYTDITASVFTEDKFENSSDCDSMHIELSSDVLANSYVCVTLSGNVNVYAIGFEDCTSTFYNITYLPATNGTISGATSAAQGMEVTLTATPDAGYILEKWTVKDASDNEITVTDNKFSMPASDVTVSATFKVPANISVTFDPNGGIGSMAPQNILEGTPTTLNANTFTYTDKTFLGWNTAKDGSGTSYDDGASVSLVGNTTLYAQWKTTEYCGNIEKPVSDTNHATLTNNVQLYSVDSNGRRDDGATNITTDGDVEEGNIGVFSGQKRFVLQFPIDVDEVIIYSYRNNATPRTLKTLKVSPIFGTTTEEVSYTDKEFTVIQSGTRPHYEYKIKFNEPLSLSEYLYVEFDNSLVVYKVCYIKACQDKKPEITTPSSVICSGNPTTLKATNFTDGATLSWYKDDVLIVGETAATLTVSEVGKYHVVATKECDKQSEPIIVTDIVDKPTITLEGNNVTFSSSTVGAKFYYTLDGSEPSLSSASATSVILSAEQTLKVIAVAGGCASDVVTFVPCDLEPVIVTVTSASIFDKKVVDFKLATIHSEMEDITFELVSQPTFNGCTFNLVNNDIRISGTPDLGITTTEIRTLQFTLKNSCDKTFVVEMPIKIHPEGTKPSLAFIVTGTEGGDFTKYTSADVTSSEDLIDYLNNAGYSVTPVNGYATKDPDEIANYYEDYDVLIVTDFLNTGLGYTNAIGSLIDKKPILTFEAFVAGESNWHISSNPTDPNPKVKDMTLLCQAHTIFGVGHEITDATVTVLDLLSSEEKAKGLQGFTLNNAPDFLFLATIKNGTDGELIVCCERQAEFTARMIIFGVNFYEMPNLSDDGKKIIKLMVDYLLETDDNNLADCAMVFDNGRDNTGTGYGDNLWSNPANWGPSYNMLPTQYHPTRIEEPCIVNVTDAHAASVKINQGNNGSQPLSGKITITPQGGLTVTGFMKKVKDTKYSNLLPVQPTDLYIKADATGNGALAVGGNDGDIRATVDFFSKARDAGEENPVWQYVGAPFSDMEHAIDYYRLAWMCRWTEEVHGLGANWEWVRNEDNMQPFRGYCITHVDNTKTYTFTGKLNASTNRVIQLTANGDSEYKGWNLVANSWMAPLQIDKMKTEDFGTGADATVYIYNTGSYADWEGYKGNYADAQYAPAGQYTTVPVAAVKILNEEGNADLPATIAPMQAFFVLTSTNTTLLLKYNDLVFNDDYTQTTTPMRAPRRAQVQKDDVSVLRIDVKGEFATDKMWIMQADSFSLGYDNGYDGKKILGDPFVPQLAVATEGGEMAIAALPQYEGTRLMFRKGSEDELYTLSFRYDGTPLLLRDLLTSDEVEISTGNTYSFYATNEQLAERFEIVKKPESQGGVTTGLTAVVDDNGLHIGNAAGLPLMLSVYTPDGRLIQQQKTAEMNYTLNLPMTGAYIVRLQSANECKIVKVIR